MAPRMERSKYFVFDFNGGYLRCNFAGHLGLRIQCAGSSNCKDASLPTEFVGRGRPALHKRKPNPSLKTNWLRAVYGSACELVSGLKRCGGDMLGRDSERNPPDVKQSATNLQRDLSGCG